jgi:arsenate reductase
LRKQQRPVVLFACIHNSGRSVAAKVLTEYHARGGVEVRSAGSEPGGGVHPVVAAVLAERGLSTADHRPTLLTRDEVQGSDVVVTMGCGERCPVLPGARYEDWPVEDPKGQDIDVVRRIVDDIDRRVRALVREILPGGVRPGQSGNITSVTEPEAAPRLSLAEVAGESAKESADHERELVGDVEDLGDVVPGDDAQ